jgi:hypothetical protein
MLNYGEYVTVSSVSEPQKRKYRSEMKVLVHSVNTHPGRPAQPDETITKLKKEE